RPAATPSRSPRWPPGPPARAGPWRCTAPASRDARSAGPASRGIRTRQRASSSGSTNIVAPGSSRTSDRGRHEGLIGEGAAGRAKMSKLDAVKIVEEFWAAVWKARDPEAIDRFVVDDFVLTTGGVDVVSRAAFKEWAVRFMGKISDLEFEVVETFQNEDG